MTDDQDIPEMSEAFAAATGATLDTSARPDIDALVQDYADARNDYERVSDEAKQLREVMEQYEGKLFDALEKANLRSVRHARGLFTLNDLAWPDITDAELARAWATDKMPELLTLNHQKLAVVVREHLKGEGAMPDGVEFHTSRKIKWRRQ